MASINVTANQALEPIEADYRARKPSSVETHSIGHGVAVNHQNIAALTTDLAQAQQSNGQEFAQVSTQLGQLTARVQSLESSPASGGTGDSGQAADYVALLEIHLA